MNKVQWRVLCGAVAMVVAVGLQPLLHQQAETLAQWQAVWPRVAAWRVASQAPPPAANRQALTSAALGAVVARSVASSGLASYWQGMPTLQGKQVSMRFKAVPFDQAITWLESLLQRYALTVQAWQVTRRSALGTVDLQLTLQA